jgi:hypothetical protein
MEIALAGRRNQAEARAAALEELVPAAIKSLRAHLGDGDPLAWRAALRVFEHAFAGRSTSFEDEHGPGVLDPLEVASRSPVECGRLAWPILKQPGLKYLVHPERRPNADQ